LRSARPSAPSITRRSCRLTNGNAAAAEGDVASPHLTGAAVDIPKSNMTRDEIAWMRTSLLALEQAGKLDVEEEFHQRCFHITVYKSYAGGLAAAAPPAEAVDSADEPASPDGRSRCPGECSGKLSGNGKSPRLCPPLAARHCPAGPGSSRLIFIGPNGSPPPGPATGN
jgi:hypothetical protein